ncbi:MAG: hypothetical protein J0H57_13145, partial [Rhodospirillales bacterium]|nr:hypothetical protein [Rhodospirillales bacterium]
MTGRSRKLPAKKAGRIASAATGRRATAKSPPPPAAAKPSAPPAPEPQVLLDLEPVVSGGFMNDRLDLTVRGRVAGEALEELVLLRDDVPVSRMQFGEADGRALARLPDGSMAPQRTFQFSMPLPGETEAGVLRCALLARTVDAREHLVRFGIMVDPTGAPPGHVVAGPLTPPGAAAGLLPHVIMFVERAAIDLAGTLTVQGWAVSMTRIVTIQAFAADLRVLPHRA